MGGPIVAGFVELQEADRGEGSVRVRNVSDEPVDSIAAVIDIARTFPRGFVYRMRVINALTLPREKRESSRFKPAMLISTIGMGGSSKTTAAYGVAGTI